ncbi:MAG: hypothetical protein AAGG02_20695 [Cyanobacteria bacterium P01_H01_bin.15]
MLKLKWENLLKRLWDTRLSDYVTGVAWSPDGTRLAASSGAGEVLLYTPTMEESFCLQSPRQSLSMRSQFPLMVNF